MFVCPRSELTGERVGSSLRVSRQSTLFGATTPHIFQPRRRALFDGCAGDIRTRGAESSRETHEPPVRE